MHLPLAANTLWQENKRPERTDSYIKMNPDKILNINVLKACKLGTTEYGWLAIKRTSTDKMVETLRPQCCESFQGAVSDTPWESPDPSRVHVPPSHAPSHSRHDVPSHL